MYRLYACRKNDNRARKIKNNVYNKIYFDSVLKQCIDMYNFDELSEIADANQLISFKIKNIISWFNINLQNRDLFILTIGTKNKSWWLEHGIGCKITNVTWMTENAVRSSRLIPPEEAVEGCLLDYYYVEVIHAGVQCLLAVSVYCGL